MNKSADEARVLEIYQQMRALNQKALSMLERPPVNRISQIKIQDAIGALMAEKDAILYG